MSKCLSKVCEVSKIFLKIVQRLIVHCQIQQFHTDRQTAFFGTKYEVMNACVVWRGGGVYLLNFTFRIVATILD